MRLAAFLALAASFLTSSVGIGADKPLKVLFLGDTGHHKPAERYRQIAPVMKERGIELTYTHDLADLNPKTLGQYDALLIYANQEKISPEQEQALLDYVAAGHGFCPIHCASYCFLNSPKYVELVGAQFSKHGTGTFRTRIVNQKHPIMQGFDGFQSWDETYVHTKHNERDRTVLELRVDDSGFEPWTWVRTHGKGRVFYTAWGHDERTWGEKGFESLLERGIRWSVGQDPTVAPKIIDPQSFPIPEITKPRTDVKPFEFIDVGAKIPNYTRGAKWGTQAEAITKMQKPLPAEESLKHIVTPVGFEVKLFMSEEDILEARRVSEDSDKIPVMGKPIAMTWDERGRLWLCETVDYPNELQPKGKGRDRIRICEDTDHDGRADKFTVFAEDLSIPTTLTFSKGGVIVQNATETLYLKDTTGDDVADERTVLFTGWGAGDTHGGVSNFQYGFDNWIWGMQGYNASRPVPQGKGQRAEGKGEEARRVSEGEPARRASEGQASRGERTQSFRQGFFRFKPDGSEIEFIRSTNNNTWGLGMSEEGLIFGSTANHNPSVFMPIPNRYYEQVRGWSPQQLGTIASTHLFQPNTDKVRQMDHHGGYTAGCGHALYTARNYPKEYWNRVAFVCEPTGHLVGSFVLRREGSDFSSDSPFNLFASDDEWTSPIMAEVGPDGNVWVLDWYNFIIQHNPTPIGFKTGKGNAYETDLRDKKHGRVYRVVYTGKGDRGPGTRDPDSSSPVPGPRSPVPFSLNDATPEKLVATLKHPNLFWRKHAQRLMVEQGKKYVDDNLHFFGFERWNREDDELSHAAIVHALWVMRGVGLIDEENRMGENIAMGYLAHPSPAVRRAALQVLPPTRTAGLAIYGKQMIVDPDPQVRLAALQAYADMPTSISLTAGEDILVRLAASDKKLDRWLIDAAISAASKHDLEFLKAAGNERITVLTDETTIQIVDRVAEHYARGAPVDTVGSLLAKLADGKPKLASTILAGLNRGWPRNKTAKLTDEDEAAIATLFKESPELRGPISSLAAKLGSKELDKFAGEIAESYLKQITDVELDAPKRIDAAKQLVNFRKSDAKTLGELLELLTPKTPPDLAAGLMEAIGQSEADGGGAAIVERIGKLTPATRQSAIRLLIARATWTPALLEALKAGDVTFAELSLDQKQALANHPERKIADAAKKLLASGGGLPNADRQKVYDELLALTKKTGDATAGKVVFEKQCMKCHTHSGKGTKIGPDLTGMAVHPKAELLVHLIDPSRSVEGNYRVYQVIMDDGRVLTGLLASETKTAVELVDVEAKRHTLVRDEIDQMLGSTKSLMPEGFEKQVTPEEITNLLEFMTQRGKFTPLSLEKVATVVSTKGMFNSEDAQAERLVFRDWSPKTFQGVPFVLVDPQGDKVRNAIMLYADQGGIPPKMPKSVTLPCNQAAKAIHLLSGVSGWGSPYGEEGSVTMIVRLKYEDGSTEDHELLNGKHFADYIQRVDVPGSQFAFQLRGQQLRYLAVLPKRPEKIKEIELVKGKDRCVPVVMAVTVEGLGSE